MATSILEAVQEEERRYPEHRVARVGLRIGEYAGVDGESLRFCWEAVVKTERLAPLELAIEWCTVEGGQRGDELDFAYMELEETGEMVA